MPTTEHDALRDKLDALSSRRVRDMQQRGSFSGARGAAVIASEMRHLARGRRGFRSPPEQHHAEPDDARHHHAQRHRP
jgi:hypothetical protein